MLNELYELSRSLDEAGLKVVSWHKFLKECPRGGKSYFVDINANSQISNVRWIADPERIASLRKFEKAAGYSFPAFNIKQLWQFDDDTVREEAAKFRKSLTGKNVPSSDEVLASVNKFLKNARSAWIDLDKKSGGRDEMDKVDGCLTAPVDELLQAVALNTDPVGVPIKTLLERVKSLNGESLHAQLSDWVVQQFSQPSDRWQTWFDLLFNAKKMSVVFELSDQSDFDCPANHVRSYTYVNACLSSKPHAESSESFGESTFDAFGNACDGNKEKFPATNVGRLKQLKLFALNKESNCQKRYGRVESAAFNVGAKTRQQCKDALEWISEEHRQGKTWCDLSAITGTKTVLIAYATNIGKDDLSLAELFGGGEGTEGPDLHNEAQFEACTQAVLKSLSSRPATDKANDVSIVILSQPDGYRTKVVFSYKCSENHILESAEKWQIGCLNHPEIRTRQFGPNEGDKPAWRSPLTPFIAEVIACANTIWIRAGTESSFCKSAAMADALSLLLDGSSKVTTTAEKLLSLVLKNTTSLLLAMGQAEKQYRVHAVAKNLQKHQLLLPRILGLLLWKLDIHKGDFMKTPPFLIGRLLSLADQLHLLYCQEVRKGDVPPQLVGNAIMPTALATPEHALAILADRMRPYKAWADTVRTGEKVGLARYFVAEMGDVCNQLAEQSLPKRTNDSDRATMLLGYLCRPRKEEPTVTTEGE